MSRMRCPCEVGLIDLDGKAFSEDVVVTETEFRMPAL